MLALCRNSIVAYTRKPNTDTTWTGKAYDGQVRIKIGNAGIVFTNQGELGDYKATVVIPMSVDNTIIESGTIVVFGYSVLENKFIDTPGISEVDIMKNYEDYQVFKVLGFSEHYGPIADNLNFRRYYLG